MSWEVRQGDAVERLREFADGSVDAVVTDPPYGLGFMGKQWDAPGRSFVAQDWHEAWAREALRVLKPGGHLLAFGGSRTYHRLACGVEDAGFEIRDSIMWLYGSGFPKSLDVAKAIDKAERGFPQGTNRRDPSNPNAGRFKTQATEGKRSATDKGQRALSDQAAVWDGWGTALKPAHEPIVVARKPLVGTVAANVLEHGTGALNIAASRIPVGDRASYERNHSGDRGHSGTRSIEDRGATDLRPGGGSAAAERWPANVVLDEVAAAELDRQTGELVSGANPTRRGSDKFRLAYGDFAGQRDCVPARGVDVGGASRFFYCAKASRAERNAGLDAFEKRPILWSSGERNPGSFQADGTDRSARNPHPTVKPIELMRWLVRLVVPPDGLVLDPFVGSGSTGCAAVLEGFRFVGVERDPDYVAIARARIEFWAAHPTDLPVEVALAADVTRRRVREGGQIGLDI